MITRLPEDICCHILTFLPITHAVATSVLCKKWKNLWTSASFTNLELDDRLPLRLESSKTMYNYASLFATFVINVLRLINLPCIRKLAFFCSDPNNLKCINSCTPLLVLKLNGNIRLDFPPRCVCFPSLKVLWIKVYSENGISVTDNLFHICRVLEDLFIEGDILYKKREVVLNVKSNTLKRLKIECLVHNFNGDIDCSFALCDDFLAKYRITAGLKVLDYAKICIGDPSADYGKLELYFEAVSYSYETQDNVEEIALQSWLRNFARDFAFRRLLYKTPEGSMPECLVLCLQEIKIWGFEGALYEFTVAEFLLAHAEVLRKMTIHVQEEVTPDAAMRFRDQVLQYPRASEACQVEIISTKNMEN
ncbi:unnamed protein product [Malus baccata var. baccata]